MKTTRRDALKGGAALAAVAILPGVSMESDPLGHIAVPDYLRDVCGEPGVYGIPVKGDCLEPIILDGDVVILSPTREALAGDFVVLTSHEGESIVKRLTLAVPPPITPGSGVVGALLTETLNPPGMCAIPMSDVAAIHVVVGIIRPVAQEA